MFFYEFYVLALNFKSLIHFQLGLECSVQCAVRAQTLLCGWSPAFAAPSVERPSLLPAEWAGLPFRWSPDTQAGLFLALCSLHGPYAKTAFLDYCSSMVSL